MTALKIKESFEPGLKKALFSNFSSYKEAFLELADNAVSNRIDNKRLKVDIVVTPKYLSIANIGGYGMDLHQLKQFLQWGVIKDRSNVDIGAYSQGGKAAMGYLGQAIRILASAHGKAYEYEFKDDNVHEYKLKEYPVNKNKASSDDGYVKIEVSGLTRKIKDDDLMEIIVDTYKPLIESNACEFIYNRQKLKAKPFPVEEKIRRFGFEVHNYTKGHNQVIGWIGYLTPKSGYKGGFRCYKLGRLISTKEYFGHPDPSYKQSLNLLFGEVHLDHIPATTNKTDFDRDSIEWQEVQERMKEIMKPYVDELLGRTLEEPTEEEKNRVKQARELVAELLKMRNKKLPGFSGIESERTEGQKEREIKNEPKLPPSAPTGRKNEPKTPPPPGAQGKRRRLKSFMDWVLRPMDEHKRSKIEGEDNNKLLVINNIFPGYKAAKGNYLYLIETAAIQLALPDEGENITPKEYIDSFDELYAFFCENMDQVRENMKKKRSE